MRPPPVPAAALSAVPAAVLSAALSAGLLFHGTGLTPVPWLTWLAPLPVLLLAPRAPAPAAAGAAFAAWAAGGLNMWSFHREQLETPLPAAVAVVTAPALLAVAAVLAFRALARRGRPGRAALSVPVIWVSGEYLMSVLGPHGALWSLAYTQAGVLPVIQLASLTGVWGVTFALTGVPAAAAALCAPGAARRARLGTALVALLLLAAAAGYGAVRLAEPPGPRRTVALLAAGQRGDWAPVDTPRGRRKLADVLARLRALPPGTETAVLAEGAFVTDTANLARITGPLAELARDRRLDIVAGVIVTDAARNTAVLLPASGGGPRVYHKRHMVPGVEPYRPGDRILVAGGSGVAICRDLDFPGLAREYRRSGARIMLVPAWDFDRDAWHHSRPAVVRGVENGFSVARSAANGDLTASDPYGRVLAERGAGSRALTTVVAAVPAGGTGTLYTRWGDWFARLCLAAAAVAGGSAAVRLARAARPSRASRKTERRSDLLSTDRERAAMIGAQADPGPVEGS
ncbi:nitrilase-related carbon-nitrogen hydrolase [Planomonospora corallina]|uniref:Nitrilase-related carbon-nitrogen hydrolase n=1 Tax=Planomonospora corallina TaxID=1806052 RepID=A0ABV8I8A7_9ACTN